MGNSISFEYDEAYIKIVIKLENINETKVLHEMAK
jgi:hypothetical protein